MKVATLPEAVRVVLVIGFFVVFPVLLGLVRRAIENDFMESMVTFTLLSFGTAMFLPLLNLNGVQVEETEE